MVAAASVLLFALVMAAPEAAPTVDGAKPQAVGEEQDRAPTKEVEPELPSAAEREADGKLPPAVKKMPPAVRAKLLMLLVLVSFLGFLALMAVWLGGRWTRFYMRHSDNSATRLPPQNIDEDDWAKKPIVPRDPPD